MKKNMMISLFFLMASLSASASDPTDVCQIIADNHQSNAAAKCLNVVKGYAHWDDDAVDVCELIARGYNFSTAVDCLEAIRNKAFTGGAVGVCHTMAANYRYNSAVSCLKQAGYGRGPTSNCNIVKLKNQVDGAIGNFYGGNDRALINTLENMKAHLERCD